MKSNLVKESGDLVKDLVEDSSSDLISRQMALDIERNATVDTNPSHFEAHQKFTQFMDDAEISSFGRWQWSNGFNTALTAVGIDLKKLPPAQPERKKGEWIDGDILNGAIDGYYANCSLCGFEMDVHAEHGYFEYCPRCGADMRGESNDRL